MQQVLLAVHVIICVCLTGLVLIQHGKGANMGALFGSSSGGSFGAQTTTSFLVKLTTWFAIAFFTSSLNLGYISMTKADKSAIIVKEVVSPSESNSKGGQK
ncbi:MAG: preprotein translocase subunit SecG [Legionellales bacterium]|jgi:preprotein translocase subunit SecG|nr:preprotein translocase subunit SecG [Legionellales bacterium]